MRKLSRNEWIAGAFEALCDGGVDAMNVEPLAKRLGVTKGSFYHHFENRRALHMAVLDAWEREGTSQIIDDVSESSSEAAARLRTLAYRAIKADPFTDSIETGIRAWAATDDEVAASSARVDARRVGFVEGLLREIGHPKAQARRRALLLYRILIGEYTWRNSGGPPLSNKEIDEVVDHLIR